MVRAVRRRRGRPRKDEKNEIYHSSSTVLNLRIDRNLKKWLRRYAEDKGINMSQVVTGSLVRLMEENMRERVQLGLTPYYEDDQKESDDE